MMKNSYLMVPRYLIHRCGKTQKSLVGENFVAMLSDVYLNNLSIGLVTQFCSTIKLFLFISINGCLLSTFCIYF